MDESNEFLRVPDAAKLLHISKSRLYHLISEQKVPVMRRAPGARVLFRKADLVKMLEDKGDTDAVESQTS